MRGVAAVGVMIYHFSPFLSGSISLPGAYLAVDLFFVLSGFVICHAYEDKLQRGMGLGQFLLIRIVRLYPLYILGTLIGLFYVLGRDELLHQPGAGLPATIRAVVLSGLFLPNIANQPSLEGLYPFNLAAWSLFFELAINLIYAAVARELTQRKLSAVVFIGALSLIVVLVVFGSLDVGMTRRTVLGGACRVTFSFAAGVLIYRCRTWMSCAPIRVRFALEALLVALVAVFWLHPLSGAFDLFCIVVLFPILIFIGSRIEPVMTPAFSALLGYLSYPIYVLHTPLVLMAAGAWKAIVKGDPSAAMPLSGATFLAFVVVSSYILTRWYDVPLRAYLNAWGRQRGARRLSAQAAFGGDGA